LKHAVFRLGLSTLSLTGAARLAAPWTAGLGAILMFHHVRPHEPRAFEPNRILEIAPAFLDAVIGHAKGRGYEVIPLGDVPGRLRKPSGRFVALTFDDGYRDNLVHALPVLQAHAAPFTIFVTTGFADRTATLWWSDLEEALERLPDLEFDGKRFPLGEARRKQAAFDAVMASLRSRPGPDLLDAINSLALKAGVNSAERVDRFCLDWDEIRALDKLDLCTVAAHTLTHPMLALHDRATALEETVGSKRRLEHMLGRPVQHFAYPVGDAVAAGPREFEMARETGFATAVTTRPGMLFPEHVDHLHALPRLSVNGLYQNLKDFDVLLSGAAFHLFNGGRRLNVA
jgi:peptidoglycan/xylan/chitin deacetylase (PgdA/CDA1 family)